MPHLGVLSTVYPEAAWNIFDKDCLIRLGSVIAPRGIGKETENVFTIEAEMPEGDTLKEQVKWGEIKRIKLDERQITDIRISPTKHFDMGGGAGKEVITKVEGGVVGVILDGRGRPLSLPEETKERQRKLLEWFKSLDMYPQEILGEIS